MDICNILEVVESHFDGDDKRIFFNRTKQTLLNTIDWNYSLATHVILTVHLHLSNAPQLLFLFGNELESFVEWEVFFFLVIDSPNSLVFIVLIDSGLNSETLVIFVLTNLYWFQVSELGNNRILGESTEETNSDWLQLLVCLRGKSLSIWILDVFSWFT